MFKKEKDSDKNHLTAEHGEDEEGRKAVRDEKKKRRTSATKTKIITRDDDGAYDSCSEDNNGTSNYGQPDSDAGNSQQRVTAEKDKITYSDKMQRSKNAMKARAREKHKSAK